MNQGSNPVFRPHLAEGTEVTVTPKNPLYSTAIWGIVITVVFGWLSKHSWWAFDRDTTVKAVEEVVGFVIGPAIAVYGRWTANRPLGLASGPKDVTVS